MYAFWPVVRRRKWSRGDSIVISVAICTYNNAAKLAVALESLKDMACPPGLDYEILVIDNNSSDETKDVVEQYRHVWGPRLRYVFEPNQGLSHARNRAMKEAAGDILSYIDDDIKADAHWLSAVAGAFERYADAAVVGGRSYLLFPSNPPVWLSDKCQLLLSRLDYGDEAIVGTEEDLFGLNFSVRKAWLERVGGFNTSLGRCGRSLLSGEESDLLKRIRALGGIAVYEPAAVVGHIVPPERMRIRWFLMRFLSAGKNNVVMARKDGLAVPSVSQAVVHVVRCTGSIFKSVVFGDWSRKTLADKLLVAAAALGGLDGRIRLVFEGGCGERMRSQVKSGEPSR
jgi:glycosyltransferase involved in cell wall biosynthesis